MGASRSRMVQVESVVIMLYWRRDGEEQASRAGRSRVVGASGAENVLAEAERRKGVAAFAVRQAGRGSLANPRCMFLQEAEVISVAVAMTRFV